jgi:hypothetical protein
MKNTFLLIMFMFTLVISAQFRVTKKDGTPILNGDIITFNKATDPESNLGFNIYNETSSPILTKILFLSAKNYDGTNFQLCYGIECYDNIVIRKSYPNNAFEIPANGKNGNFDHFLNTNTGDGKNYPMDFNFKFFTVDKSNNEIGTPINFTYRYDPNQLSVSDFSSNLKKMGIEIGNTIVANDLQVYTSKKITIDIFDISGKKLMNKELNVGNNNVNMTSLPSSFYILKVKTLDNQSENIKIFKE